MNKNTENNNIEINLNEEINLIIEFLKEFIILQNYGDFLNGNNFDFDIESCKKNIESGHFNLHKITYKILVNNENSIKFHQEILDLLTDDKITKLKNAIKKMESQATYLPKPKPSSNLTYHSTESIIAKYIINKCKLKNINSKNFTRVINLIKNHERKSKQVPLTTKKNNLAVNIIATLTKAGSCLLVMLFAIILSVIVSYTLNTIVFYI